MQSNVHINFQINYSEIHGKNDFIKVFKNLILLKQ